jgi:hypothetical protein
MRYAPTIACCYNGYVLLGLLLPADIVKGGFVVGDWAAGQFEAIPIR